MKYKKGSTKKRRHNPVAELAIAGNPGSRTGKKKTGKRRHNPTGFRLGAGGIGRALRSISLTEIAATGAGLGLHLWGFTKAPAQAQRGILKYVWLFGLPVLVKTITGNRIAQRLADGGLVAAAVHLANDFLPPVKGRLLPAFLTPGASELPTVEGIAGYLPAGTIGEEALDMDEMERALVQGVGAYDRPLQGVGYADYERTSGLGRSEEELFRIS